MQPHLKSNTVHPFSSIQVVQYKQIGSSNQVADTAIKDQPPRRTTSESMPYVSRASPFMPVQLEQGKLIMLRISNL